MRDPLAIEFANTRYMLRGEPRDGLATAKQARAWLKEHGLASTPFRAADVDELVVLRDAIRNVFGRAAAGRPLPRTDIKVLNEASRLAPAWPELTSEGAAPAIVERSRAEAKDQVTAAIARSAMQVVGDDQGPGLRACQGPGCVQFFEPSATRRVWCCAGCGNRARVARHYRRHRESGSRSG